MFGAIWLVAIAGGVWRMVAYATTSGTQAGSPEQWPADSRLERDPHAFTVVMFVHPDCPCSRASLAELGEVTAAVPASRARVIVAFASDAPEGTSWDTAGRLARVTRHVDRGGAEARRFGAVTSGYVVAYDTDGRLRFSGGITDSRGHVGDNIGRDQLVGVLRGEPMRREHAVFGCELFAAEAP